MHVVWLNLTYDLLGAPKLTLSMAESFVNLEDSLPDWTNEDMEKSLAKVVDKLQKQEEGKTRSFVELQQYTRAVSGECY